jgi:hypothetical protein
MKPRTKSQNGKRARRKGISFELEVVKALQGIGIAAERNIAQTRTAAREGCDVEGTPWWLELSCGAAPDPRAKYAQAMRDWYGNADDLRPIVVVTKRDRCEPIVTVAACELAAWYTGEAMGRQMDGPLVTLRFADWLDLVKP